MVRCVCRSIKPGSKVASPKSSTVAPGGTLRLAPTSAIFSPSTRTIAGTSGARPRPSIRRPALIIVMGAGVGCVSATAGRHVVPPSATRKHPSFRSRIFMNCKLTFAAPVHQAATFTDRESGGGIGMTEWLSAARKAGWTKRKLRLATRFPRPTSGTCRISSAAPINGARISPGFNRLIRA